MADKRNDPAADTEKAEGERENAQPGITNRPLEQEQEEQRELPPRGTAKRED